MWWRAGWRMGGGASQTWQLAGDRSGQTVVLNANSGKAIGAPMLSAGASLDQETVDGGAAQRWTLQPAGGLFYRLVSADGLAIAGGMSGPTISLVPLDCTSTAQQWSVAASPTTNATYTLVNHKTGWLVDVNGQSTTAGATVIQWPANGGLNQEWRLTAGASGGFVLVNANSSLAMGVGSSGADQETPSGAATQTWTLSLASAGYYTLASGGGGGVLASPSANQGDELVVVPSASGDPSQEWMLAPAP